MNILIVNPLLGHVYGGAEMNDLKLGQGLLRLGHAVSYCRIKSSLSEDLGKKDIVVDMSYSYDSASMRTGLLGKILRNLFFWRFYRKLIHDFQSRLDDFDLVLLTGKPVMTGLARKTKSRVLYSVRGGLGFSGKFGKLNQYLTLRADGLIYWGGCEKDAPEEMLKKTNYIALDPAIDESVFFPRKADMKLRKTLKVKNDNSVIIFVGRLEHVKRVDCMIQAVANLKNKGVNIHFSIVGDGSLRLPLHNLANKVAPGCVTFWGRQESTVIAEMLRASDIFLLYSHFENHPISLKEAVACRTYCIAADIGRVKSIVNEGAGIVIPSNKPSELEEAIEARLSDKLNVKDLPIRDNILGDGWQANGANLISWIVKSL